MAVVGLDENATDEYPDYHLVSWDKLKEWTREFGCYHKFMSFYREAKLQCGGSGASSSARRLTLYEFWPLHKMKKIIEEARGEMRAAMDDTPLDGAPPPSADTPDSIPLNPRCEFEREEADVEDEMSWVMKNLEEDKPDPATAPSRRAWCVLVTCRKDETKGRTFVSKWLDRNILKKQEGGAEERLRDDNTPASVLLDRLSNDATLDDHMADTAKMWEQQVRKHSKEEGL